MIRVGVLGCGTVGGSLIDLLQRDRNHIAARTGLKFDVTKVAVRDLAAQRSVELPDGVLTTDVAAVVNASDVDVVVETIGGTNPAADAVMTALRAGKPVVTANKELLAAAGKELFEAAAAGGVDLAFEASVAAGIPLISALRQTLVGERVTRLMGIVNGTTNFILTKMTEEDAGYDDVLAEAQRLGYAEADPTADVEGADAAAKAAILAMMAFGADVTANDVYTEGIAKLRPSDIAAARRMGHVIKLLAVVEQVETAPADTGSAAEFAVEARVHPTMVPADHPLAAVRDSFNAVFLQGEAVGDLMLYGRGAGGYATASAVLGDLIMVATNLTNKVRDRLPNLVEFPVKPIGETVSAYHVSMSVLDAPGVLAVVAGVFGEHDVSIGSMEQTAVTQVESAPEHDSPDAQRGADAAAMPAAVPSAHLEFITHRAREADVQATLRALSGLAQVHSVGTPIRVIGD